MTLVNDFESFIKKIALDKLEAMKTTTKEIAKKLNKIYYDLDDNTSEHMYIVGSVGRGTSIKGASDLDLLFDLPSDIYKKYDNYGENSNGQSVLLQEVKNVLLERYPKTKISGDGQVVVIEFINYTVELVPGFKQNDGSFKYPDTHDKGSWKITNPMPEIKESRKMAEDTNNNFVYICNMVKSWKNHIGFKLGGLLIDTLVYKFLNENNKYKTINYDKYFDMIKCLFAYLKDLNKEQSYWYALGSNQKVYNCDNGKFITNARKAYDKISSYEGTESDVNNKLREIFGNDFSESISVVENQSELNVYRTEQFIEKMFPVDIRYNLNIDCEVTQKGFRSYCLRYMLANNIKLMKNKSLKFEIKGCDIPGGAKTCDIYWKVRNVGAEAIRLDRIRGQVIKTNSKIHREHTSFQGAHYVECYLVKNGVCIAKDRIEVPIN